MANDATVPGSGDSSFADQPAAKSPTDSNLPETTLGEFIYQGLKPLASLKLTVVLFALAIFLVFAGTMAQWKLGVWRVVDTYFRSAVTWIEFQVFFPPSWFPSKPQVPGGFPFPGGWLIGTLLAINLFSAHLIRFKARVEGPRFWLGMATLAIGCVVTGLVILSGSNTEGFHYTTNVDWNTFWYVFLFTLAASWMAVTAYAVVVRMKESMAPGVQRPLFWFLVTASVVIGFVTIWLGYLQIRYPGDESVRLNDSSMRILWQLLSATFAGLVLLAGCGLLFRKRAGIVLLHGGIFLMMFGEVLVGVGAVESDLVAREGETVDFIQHDRKLEVSVVDTSDSEFDEVVAVPFSLLREPGDRVSHEGLPFDIELLERFENSSVKFMGVEGRENKPESPHAKMLGIGRFHVAMGKPNEPGTSSRRDVVSAYIRLLDKDTSKPIGTVLLSQWLQEQEIEIGDETRRLTLRAERTYKPFTMYLDDVRERKYLGTTIPMSYSSDLWLADPDRSVDQAVRVWMNNPLRYGGQTFYQSGYTFDPNSGVESTTLQVVTNTGWMIPYVGCMIVAVGMIAQFWFVLGRFLTRRAKEESSDIPADREGKKASKSRRNDADAANRMGASDYLALFVPILLVVMFAGMMRTRLSPPDTPADEMNLYEFGKLPVMFEGRVKPFDTLAASSLLVISNRASFKDADDEKQPAILWLMDVITNPKKADSYKVFRIENEQLLHVLGLEKRPGLRYAYDEFKDKLIPKPGKDVPEFRKQLSLARKVSRERPDDVSAYQRRVLKLNERLVTYELLKEGFRVPELPTIPTLSEMRTGSREELVERLKTIRTSLEDAAAVEMQLLDSAVPRAVPKLSRGGADDDEAGPAWIPFSVAWPRAYLHSEFDKMRGSERTIPFEEFMMFFRDGTTVDFLRRQHQRPEDLSAAAALQAVFEAYRHGNAGRFNGEVASYQGMLVGNPPQEFSSTKLSLEARFNQFQPFLWTSFIYILVFVLVGGGWLSWNQEGVLRIFLRSAVWLLAFALIVHTSALVVRMIISGRPPVTNLYSSAIFIGWGAVVLGLCFEWFYRNGIGLALASITGFLTLMVAYYLSLRGDTIEPMRAVLDTQFWLATHVVIISLGYSATFLAGVFGIFYILRGVFTPTLTPAASKELHRMIYGTVCFAIVFSFVGTVLGGLWGDDSWGRFWGWDPKENGALIIVLWNALVLHARFGGLVKDRGLAVLAVVGNIVTAWSWFGVNELKVGLHTYGFTEGVLMWLLVLVACQLVIITLGCLPKHLWLSFKDDSDGKPVNATLAE